MTFTADQFKSTKFDTAQDKADFANQFVKFVESGFNGENFLQEFYERLCQTFGHIAHYDGPGFWNTFFTDIDSKVKFIKQCADYTPVGDPAWTYVDVERVLQSWMSQPMETADQCCLTYVENILEKCLRESDEAYQGRELAEYKRLKLKFGGIIKPSEPTTYNELAELIKKIPADHRNDHVTIYLRQTDEWFAVCGCGVADATDVLDEGHPFLEIDA